MIKLIKKIIPAKLKNSIKERKPQHVLEGLISATLPSMCCVDVGASYHPHVKWPAFLKSKFVKWIAVEPNTKNLKYTENWRYSSNLSVCTTGLSEMGGDQTLYITNIDSGSSLLEPVIAASMGHRVNSHYFFPVREQIIQTLKLTDIIEEVEIPTIVKLDTQGTELSILRGANDLLMNSIVGIEMESTLLAQPVMKGSGKFWEAASYLENRGFELLHLHPIYAPPRLNESKSKRGGFTFLNECDAVFVKRRDIIERMDVDYKMALFAFYCAYSFYEEAILFLDSSNELKSYLANKGQNIDTLKNVLNKLV
ncbi:FkbM family methyltransferase [Bdellovibrio sp. HCB2-146]|uniref:FkbM family methyltransferase n=1 Tax=Bdellovibrio sp. HCB2-146 TaxID=3394362 RepID=UPI0039BCA860